MSMSQSIKTSVEWMNMSLFEDTDCLFQKGKEIGSGTLAICRGDKEVNLP